MPRLVSAPWNDPEELVSLRSFRGAPQGRTRNPYGIGVVLVYDALLLEIPGPALCAVPE